MRFETSQSTPSQINRRLQLRMLSFVAMFAVVMFFVNVVITDPPKKQDDAPGRSGIARRNRATDNDVRDDRSRSRNDDGVAIAEPDRFETPIERSREWLDEQAANGEEWAEDAAARDREAARRNTRFNKRALANVKDNTLGIRRDEDEAYFRLLDHVKHVSLSDLERAAATDVQYINLMAESDHFRGEPITIQGDLWRLYEFEAGPNTRGLTTLYEAWIFTSDSGNHPYRVVSTSLPHTLIPGENIRQPVRVTGYFFKREGYPSQGGMHVAPTLIASTVIPFRPAHAIPLTDAITPYLTGVVTAVGLALLVTLLACTLGDRRIKRITRQRTLNEPAPSFAGLDVVPFVTVEESLRRFAELKRQTDLRDEIAATGRDAGSVATTVLYRRDPHASVPPPVPVATLSDDELHLRQVTQANVLQSWTARQQTAENEVARSRANDEQLNREQRETDRVLNRLDPVATDVADHNETESADGSVFTLGPTRTNRSATEVAAGDSSVGLGSSKLAEWEREIQQFSDRGMSTTSTAAAEEHAAKVQLDRDRLNREQELRDRLLDQRTKMEQKRQEQLQRLERERAATAHAEWEAARAAAERERVRIEREQLLRDEQERERVARERLTFDRADRVEKESSRDVDRSAEETDVDESSSLTEEEREERRKRGGRRGGWVWPRRRPTSEDGDSDQSAAAETTHRIDAEESLGADDDSTSDIDQVADDVADPEVSDNGTTKPKKTGWARHNEQRAKNRRPRRRDNR